MNYSEMVIINYSDYIEFANQQEISDFCKANQVIFDFKLWDIPKTMRRNIKTLAELGGHAVTVTDDPYFQSGVSEAQAAGKEYGIKIIVGSITNES